MANWSNPTTTSTYLNFVDEVKNRDVDLALQFDGTPTALSNLPNGTVRWNSATGVETWQKWNATTQTWGNLSSFYRFPVVITSGYIAANLFSPSPVNTSPLGSGLYTPATNALALCTGTTTFSQRFGINSTGVCFFGSDLTQRGVNSRVEIRPLDPSVSGEEVLFISSDSEVGATIEACNTSTLHRAILNLHGSQGSSSAPTAVQVENYLGTVRFRGFQNGDYRSACWVSGHADLSPTGSYVPGRLSFWTTNSSAANGSTPGFASEKFRIDSVGGITMGHTLLSTPAGWTRTPGFSGNSATGIGMEPWNGAVFLSRQNIEDGPALSINSNGSASGTAGAATGTGNAILFNRAGTATGSISYLSNGQVAYNVSSDYRLKENIQPLLAPVARLKQLNPVRFNFLNNPNTTEGFVAHEVQAVVPGAVTGEKDAETPEGDPIYQSLDPSKMIPLLTAALQEAFTRIEALEAQLTP